MRKLRRYFLIAVLLGLVGLTYWLLNNRESSSQISFSEPTLSIPVSSQPDSIALVHQNKANSLTFKNPYLYFNGDYRVKPELQEAFFVILKQMEVRRPVSKKQQAELLAVIDSAGVQVNVYESGILLKSFEVWGDKREKVTYIKESDKEDIYVVTIPGHSVYVAEIFFYKENQWRSNTLFSSTWRSLKTLDVQFPKPASGGFSVKFSEDFFYIPELEAFDTLALIDYLETFSNVRIIRYLSDQQKIVDSISDRKADLMIKIEDFDSSNSDLLQFYVGDSTKSTKEVLVMQEDGSVGFISLENFRKIAKEDRHFSYTGQKE